jgi:riboflavin synthase
VQHKPRSPRVIVGAVFTGIVRELGQVEAVEKTKHGVRLRVRGLKTAPSTSADSVSVNGVCLTAVEVEDGVLDFDVVPETLRRSTLCGLAAGAAVNLEPALQAGDPVGGHFVQGHVDGVARVRNATDEGLELQAEPEILRYCVEKGSIALEGVSLTIARLDGDAFTVALVPHTKEVTTLGRAARGDELNVEVDMLAKYVEKLAAG